MKSMLELTDAERATVDLVSVVHSENIGNVFFRTKLVGYSGGRDGSKVFEDQVEYHIATPGDEIPNAELLKFAEASFCDAGIDVRGATWQDEFGGFEHHARVAPRALEA